MCLQGYRGLSIEKLWIKQNSRTLVTERKNTHTRTRLSAPELQKEIGFLLTAVPGLILPGLGWTVMGQNNEMTMSKNWDHLNVYICNIPYIFMIVGR
jgi:hypothetical protein